ncbi:unnamed protein product, partial [Protopolystoma xenopodis]
PDWPKTLFHTALYKKRFPVFTQPRIVQCLTCKSSHSITKPSKRSLSIGMEMAVNWETFNGQVPHYRTLQPIWQLGIIGKYALNHR